MARASCDSFFRAGLPLVICFGGVLLIILTVHGNNLEKKNLHELLLTIMFLASQELNAKNTLQTLFAVLIELGLFEWGGSQHAAGVSIDLRDKVFTEHNVRQIYSIPAEYQGRVGALRCKRGDVDFWFLVVYLQGRTEADRLRVSRLWRYVVSLVSALPHRCVQVLFTECNGKTACIGMLTVFVSPLKLLSLVAALLSWKIATAPFFANVWKSNFCVLSTFMWLLDIHVLAILQVYALGLIMVCLQHAMLHTVVSSAVLSSLGAQLQRIRGPGKRDPIPVSMFFRHHCSFQGSIHKVATWDMSSLANGVLRGDARHRLVSAVARNCAGLAGTPLMFPTLLFYLLVLTFSGNNSRMPFCQQHMNVTTTGHEVEKSGQMTHWLRSNVTKQYDNNWHFYPDTLDFSLLIASHRWSLSGSSWRSGEL